MPAPLKTDAEKADAITDEARRILATPLGQQPGCTYVASKADWMRAAQEALDGETSDLEFLLYQEASEPWLCNAESDVVRLPTGMALSEALNHAVPQ